MYKIKSNKIKLIIGSRVIKRRIKKVFDNSIIEFLNHFSNNLIRHKKTKDYPDLIALAFWCTSKNFKKHQLLIKKHMPRVGKGILFHIAPSNVPTNFFYSLVFGILTGNTNIVKIPSNNFPQIAIICDVLKKLLKSQRYKKIKELIFLVSYSSEHSKPTDFFSEICDLRIIWGGDLTINKVRSSYIRPDCIDIVFSDKYSVSIINSKKILSLGPNLLVKLTKNFYNDTYSMDQNACSSPHVVFWEGNRSQIKLASEKFWKSLSQVTKSKYIYPDVASVEKYAKFCIEASNKNINKAKFYNNSLYVIDLKKLDKNLHNKRGKWGYFYQYKLRNFNLLKNIINSKYQTLTYFGYNKKELHNLINQNNLEGIDRVVPIGTALNMNFNWDGYDIISSLSRIIEIK